MLEASAGAATQGTTSERLLDMIFGIDIHLPERDIPGVNRTSKPEMHGHRTWASDDRLASSPSALSGRTGEPAEVKSRGSTTEATHHPKPPAKTTVGASVFNTGFCVVILVDARSELYQEKTSRKGC